jgi:hypothetical protein
MSFGCPPDQAGDNLTEHIKTNENHRRNRQRRQSANESLPDVVERSPKSAEVHVHVVS